VGHSHSWLQLGTLEFLLHDAKLMSMTVYMTRSLISLVSFLFISSQYILDTVGSDGFCKTRPVLANKDPANVEQIPVLEIADQFSTGS
jgi:hypothetical protein